MAKDWDELPDMIRDGLESAGIDQRSFEGDGGPDVPLLRANADDADPWIQDAFEDLLSWDTAAYLGANDVRPFDDWSSYQISNDGDGWVGTITYDDGSSQTVEFGQDWAAVWDLYAYVDSIIDDAEAERGDIDYSSE